MEYVVPAIATVIVAIIEAVAAKERKENKAAISASEKRAKIRAEESRLSMALMNASVMLGLLEAEALAGGHLNGNVEEAKRAAKKAKDDYDAFLQRTAAEAAEEVA